MKSKAVTCTWQSSKHSSPCAGLVSRLLWLTLDHWAHTMSNWGLGNGRREVYLDEGHNGMKHSSKVPSLLLAALNMTGFSQVSLSHSTYNTMYLTTWWYCSNMIVVPDHNPRWSCGIWEVIAPCSPNYHVLSTWSSGNLFRWARNLKFCLLHLRPVEILKMEVFHLFIHTLSLSHHLSYAKTRNI